MLGSSVKLTNRFYIHIPLGGCPECANSVVFLTAKGFFLNFWSDAPKYCSLGGGGGDMYTF